MHRKILINFLDVCIPIQKDISILTEEKTFKY